MTEFLIFSPILLIAGVLCLKYPRQIGIAFCRLGKAIWRVGTFGITDMAFFYPEAKAPRVFKTAGIMLIIFSIPFGVIGVLSLSGPGELDAMRECSGYLKSTYGATNKDWELSARSADTGLDDYFIDYRYDDHKGTLRATWKSDHYIFIEEKPPPK